MKKITLSVLIFLLSGCFFGNTTQSRFYQLQVADTNVKAVSNRRMDIGVEEAFVPKYLDRPQIVTAEAGTAELKVSEFNRWAEPLSSSFSRVLADDISLYLPKSVVKFKTLSSESFVYTVTVEINNWSAVLGKKMETDVWWTVYKNGNVVYRQRSKQSADLEPDFEALAEVQSKLINELALQIAQKLAKL